MFLRVVILHFAAACCTARMIDVAEKQSPWERSGKFEGDIMLTDEEKFSGRINSAHPWPGKTVPFYIDPVFSAADVERIMQAVGDYLGKTTIRLVRQTSPPTGDYIHITAENSGCWSYVGHHARRQQLNLQPNQCLSKGTIIHELLHALGFWHQHSARDRDNFVTINWDNVEEGAKGNFTEYYRNDFGVPYDYASVMHYDAYAFSRNGEETIEPKDPNAQIGQSDGFSKGDIRKLELMYENIK